MKYCQNCGKEIENTANFCGRCGSTHSAQPQQDISGNHLHCPRCRATQLSPIVETEVSGGTAVHGSITRRVGISSFNTKNIHRNYWMCQNCGHKFRSIDSLEEELLVQEKAMKSARLFLILLIAGTLYLFASSQILTGIMMIPFAGFFLGLLLSFKNKVANLRQETEYLKTNCFN